MVMVVAPEVKTDPLAILSLVFGCLGLLFFCLFGWVFGLAGIGLGIASIVRVRGNQQLDGMPLAIAGIVLSAFPVVFGIWASIIMLQSAANTPH